MHSQIETLRRAMQEPCGKGKTKCRIHGGANDGPPKGNKNALKHGAYEAISLETMTEEEIAYAMRSR